MRFLAEVHAAFHHQIEPARHMWDALMRFHSREATMWLAYIAFEQQYGDEAHVRQLFKRAVGAVPDGDLPQVVCDAWLVWERMHGDRDQLQYARYEK